MSVQPSASRKMGALLIVEDDAELRQAFVSAIGEAGFVVASADSVRAGLAMLRSIHFDILLTDYGLPDGNGVEMLARAQAERLLDSTRTILCTGNRDVIAPAGMLLLRKPLDIDDLFIAIAAASFGHQDARIGPTDRT